MRSAVWGARVPRSAWTRMTHWVLGGAVVVILGTLIATGAVAWHEGYRLYAVKTGSMTPALPVGSLIVDAPARAPYHRGDVVTVERPYDTSNPVVTHRIFAVGPAGGVRTKGDANPEPDVFVAKPANVIGEVVHSIPYGGYVLFYFSQWTGVLSLMTLVLTVWLAWGICFPATTETSPVKEKMTLPSRQRVPRQRTADVSVASTVVRAPVVETSDERVPVAAPVVAGSGAEEPRRIPEPRRLTA